MKPDRDQELELRAGIRPADHAFVTSDVIREKEREMLGPEWFRPRPPKEDK